MNGKVAVYEKESLCWPESGETGKWLTYPWWGECEIQMVLISFKGTYYNV